MELMNLSCEGFLEELASKAAAPGGGGASALVGAAGVALGSMVGSLTVGKKKYAAVEADIAALNVRAEALRKRLEALVQADAEAFLPVAAAYKLPKETPEQQAQAEALKTQAEKLSFLVDALVKSSRLDNGILTLSPAPHPIQPLLEDAAAQGAAAAAEKGISLTVQPCTGSARFDAKWTSEALFNVVDNALKYTPPGGRVTLSAECYELFCRIRVTDSGPGIPEEEQAQVFSRFYRGAAVREQDGLGLGLYLTRRILIRQGGYLRLFSRPGQGSEFSLYLPLE